ncbi:MAG: sulfite exporter TauE/SafE family protein [Snowella sp.]|nr:sulfite exporter TauE/SafE family protein [Snowella sp.]
MIENQWIFLTLGGLISGLLAGLLGIGGGTVLVPILVTLQYTPVQAVATSSLAIVLTSISGSIQNWRMGYLDFNRVFSIGFPALVTAQLGVYLASQFSSSLLLIAFGFLLIINIFLVRLRKNLERQQSDANPINVNPMVARLGTGAAAGLLAGLFGVGGGVIMVPLQMLLLGEQIKVAIQTSLGVIVITAIAATVGHAFKGNVLFTVGLILGIGGLIGAQVSTRYLPKLPEQFVSFCFNLLLAILSIYTFWQAWQKFIGN